MINFGFNRRVGGESFRAKREVSEFIPRPICREVFAPYPKALVPVSEDKFGLNGSAGASPSPRNGKLGLDHRLAHVVEPRPSGSGLRGPAS